MTDSTLPVAGTATHQDVQLLVRGDPVTFGRDPTASITIGRSPVVDENIPRIAGRILVAGRRLAVENLDDVLALDIIDATGPPIPLRPGMLVSPPNPRFEVVIQGTFEHQIAVNTNTKGTVVRTVPVDHELIDDLPTGLRVELTERQRQLIDAYVEPVLGGGSPATHQAVAEQLNISRSLVRHEANAIWSAMILAGIPLRELNSNIEQIVDAWTRHRL